MPPHHGRAPLVPITSVNAAPRRGFGAFVVTVVTLLILGVVLRSVGSALARRNHAPISPVALQASGPPATRAPSPTPFPISTDVPAVVQRLAGLGYPLRCGGDRKPLAALVSEVVATQRAITRATGFPVALFRPPYGAHDATLDTFLVAHGLLEVLWSIDSLDSQGASPDEILARVSSGLRPGAIIL